MSELVLPQRKDWPMASYEVAAGKVGAHAKALVADTVDTVTFKTRAASVEVVSDGTAELYFSIDGTTPTVGGDNCYYLPATASSREVPVPTEALVGGAEVVVKLISHGTTHYSVARVSQ